MNRFRPRLKSSLHFKWISLSNWINHKIRSLPPFCINLLFIGFILSITANIYWYNYGYYFEEISFIDNSSNSHIIKNGGNIEYSYCYFENEPIVLKKVRWDTIHSKDAICLCNTIDNNCPCAPSVAVDLVTIITDSQKGDTNNNNNNNNNNVEMLFVDRKAVPLGLATVGGFVELNETFEQAAKREFLEETGISIKDEHLTQVHCYSDPNQDTRRPSSSCIYLISLTKDYIFNQNARAGDDAQGLVYVPLDDSLVNDLLAQDKGKFAFNAHRQFVIDGIALWQSLTAHSLTKKLI